MNYRQNIPDKIAKALIRERRRIKMRQEIRANAYWLKKEGVPHTTRNKGTIAIIRIRDIKIDLYMSANRWRNINTKKTFSGGAQDVIKYLKIKLTGG